MKTKRKRTPKKPVSERLIDLPLDGLASSGLAVGRLLGKVVFVQDGCPGDFVRARITKTARKFDEAQCVEVLAPSPDRVQPRCPVFGTCGGCHWQHIDYQRQLQEKRRIVVDALRKFAGIPDVPVEIIGAQDPYGTRSKARLHNNHKGEVGFFARKSHAVVPFESCPALLPELDATLKQVKEFLTRNKLDFNFMEIGYSEYKDRCVLALSAAKPAEDNAIDTLLQSVPKLCGVVWSSGKQREVFGNSAVQLGTKDIAGVHHQIDSFWQANAALNGLVQQQVAEELEVRFNDREQKPAAIELFSGSGNFTSVLAAHCRRVVSVELDERAVSMAQQNMQHSPAQIIPLAAGAADGLTRLLQDENEPKPDVLFLDPPRAGCPDGMEHILALKPHLVVYLSCDPATQARDLRPLLLGGYRLQRVTAFDFFSQTRHVESLAILERVKT